MWGSQKEGSFPSSGAGNLRLLSHESGGAAQGSSGLQGRHQVPQFELQRHQGYTKGVTFLQDGLQGFKCTSFRCGSVSAPVVLLLH